MGLKRRVFSFTAVFYAGAAGIAWGQVPMPFSRELVWQGESYAIMATRTGSINELTITPPARFKARRPIKRDIEGTVSGVAIGDLNGDSRPEILVFVNSVGSGGYGSVVAYAVDPGGRRLQPIAFDPFLTGKAGEGYMGHDIFTLAENTLTRRFPVYRQGDTQAAPSGGTRQLSYKLQGERRRLELVLDKSMVD